jgi:hypothetical protein
MDTPKSSHSMNQQTVRSPYPNSGDRFTLGIEISPNSLSQGEQAIRQAIALALEKLVFLI